jgi:hypothetical protein
VPETNERAGEYHYDKQCRTDAADERQGCGTRQEPFPAFQAGKICLELNPHGIIVRNLVDAADTVDDGCQPRN